MIDLLLKIGISNTCFALALAMIALFLGFKAKRPHLAHLFWLLVLIKLVTPPLVTVPGIAFLNTSESAGLANSIPVESIPLADEATMESASIASLGTEPGSEITAANTNFSLSTFIQETWIIAQPWLVAVWLLGSLVVLAVSLWRVIRFNRKLAENSELAPQRVQAEAGRIMTRLGIKCVPEVRTTSANLSPMVWWCGGRVQVVIPNSILEKIPVSQWRWVLAHELAHVRRRDYLVRWLEWLACVLFWWNPLVWWAQQKLRATEEICCDALVLNCLQPKRKIYAQSILKAVEFLATPALRPPAMASEINSGGVLERRFKMIVSNRENRVTSKWLRAGVLLCALLVLPLGLASAQDFEAVAKRLKKSVKNGEITQKQADAMMSALKKSKNRKLDPSTDKWIEIQRDRQDKWREFDGFKKRSIDERALKLRKAEENIQDWIKSGKINKKQAAEKLEALKKQLWRDDPENDGSPNRKRRRQDPDTFRSDEFDSAEIRKKIDAAVKAGKMSKRDAAQALEELKKRMKMRKKGVDEWLQREDPKKNRRTDMDVFKQRIEDSFKSGNMSKEDAAKALAAIKKRMEQQKRRADDRFRDEDPSKNRRIDLDGLKKRIEDGLQSGDMSKEDAAKVLAAIKKRMEQEKRRVDDRWWDEDPSNNRRIDFDSFKKRIEDGIKSGNMSKEDAAKALEAIKKRTEQQKRRADDRVRDEDPSKNRRIDLDGLKKRIEDGLKSGDISKEDAAKVLAAIKKRMEQGNRRADDRVRDEDPSKNRRIDFDVFKKRIEDAVKSGDMSKEDAAKLYEGIMKRMQMQDRNREKDENSQKRLPGRIADFGNDGRPIRDRTEQKRNDGRRRAQDPDENRVTDFDLLKQKIESAVKSGEWSKRQAADALKNLKRRTDYRRKNIDDGG